MWFRVIGTAADGSAFDSERSAATQDELAAELRREGVAVRSIEPVETDGHSARGRLTHEEARDFAQHVAGLTQAGLPLPDGLRALGEELPPGTLRRLVRELAGRLDQGESLEDALEQVGNRFPGHLRGLILAGARSGRIDTLLGEFVNYSQVGIALRRSMWLSLSYPFMMIMAYGIVFVFLSYVVVRGFEAIFKDFGIDLPAVTVLLLRASHAVTSAGWATIVAPIVAVSVVFFAGRVLLDPASRSQALSYLPLFGPLARWTSLAEFSHYLGLLIECEIPLSRSVVLAAEGARDAGLSQACQAAAQEIESGETLADSISWWRVFPGGFTKMLRWAEGHQSLPETLHMTADMFEARARAHAAFIGSVCGIVSIVIILWGCAFVVVALFLPLITLISKLSG
jgi:type II secretory pathway component PulF